MTSRKERRKFGQITRLPSGRYRARYADPDGRMVPPSPAAISRAAARGQEAQPEPLRHNAPHTFDTAQDAEAWLTDERRLISSGAWTSPADRAADKLAQEEELTFGRYAETWLRDRDLKPRTRHHYRDLLDRLILPTFGTVPLAAISPASVRQWHALIGTGTPTLRAHAYGLLRTILGQAERDELISRNPAHIRKAGSAKRAHEVKPLSLAELEALVAAMPQERRLMVLLAAWCALRFGELAELRRKDIDLRAGAIRVRRGVVRVDGKTIVGPPKTDAGIRDVSIPPHLLPVIRQHLADNMTGREALLFPGHDGQHLAPSTLYGKAPRKATANRPATAGHGFYGARAAAGRPDLRFHDLRHTGAVLAAQTGATLAELMGRLGHSTQGAAMRYQHAAAERDREIARRLSAMAEGATS